MLQGRIFARRGGLVSRCAARRNRRGMRWTACPEVARGGWRGGGRPGRYVEATVPLPFIPRGAPSGSRSPTPQGVRRPCALDDGVRTGYLWSWHQVHNG